MGTTKINELKKQYEFVCNEYIDAFIKKQSISFDGWIGDTVGGIAYCNDFYHASFFLNFSFVLRSKLGGGNPYCW